MLEVSQLKTLWTNHQWAYMVQAYANQQINFH